MEDLIGNLNKSDCKPDLKMFIKMRLASQFFNEEYKKGLMAAIETAIQSGNWAEVTKIMWPQLG